MAMVTFTGPWGDVYLNPEKDHDKVIEYTLKQLEYFKSKKKTVHLLQDIEGYKMVLASKNKVENSKNFLNIKKSLFRQNRRLRNNLEVIKYMKDNKVWIYD